MSGINPFDPERDPALGAMLRDALTGTDQAGFIARVRASVALTRQERTFDVLARWLRPNIAAAAAALMMLGAALWWGAGDFTGGLATRRSDPFRQLVTSAPWRNHPS